MAGKVEFEIGTALGTSCFVKLVAASTRPFHSTPAAHKFYSSFTSSAADDVPNLPKRQLQEKSEQLHERHARSDFETKTQDGGVQDPGRHANNGSFAD